MKLKRIFPLITIVSLFILPACFKDNEAENYSQWRQLNQNYIDSVAMLSEDGKLLFTPVTPDWDKSFTIYMRWHNEERNPSEVTPLSNSTCIVKYTLTNIQGDTLDSSASFTCVPNNMVTGFMTALTNMRVNDTITAVVPFTAGYGVFGYGGILPYSTLIFGIRLDSIPRLL